VAVTPAAPPAVSVWPFVRLKLRLTANGLRGRPARITLFVLGVLAGGVFAILGYAGLAVPGVLGSDRAAGIVLPIAGGVLVLGWLFLPLLFFGVDESLDPARFALLPLRRRTLIAGLFTAGLAGIPALSTLVASLGMVDSVARLGGPVAALTELLGVILGLLLSVALSRAVTSAFANALRSRRARDLATVLLAVLAALLGPLQLLLLTATEHANWDAVGALAKVLSWTPVGAPYSLGLDVVDGRAWAVPVKLVIVLAAGAVLLWWWGSTLERAMIGSSSSSGRTAGRGPARAPVGRLLLPGLPATRFGALVAREVRYWRRETRRRATLVTLTVAGLFLPISLAISHSSPGAMAIFVGALAALALANQFGLDGNAYAANMIAGVPGRVEIQSRVVAHAIYVIPMLSLNAVVIGVVSGRPGSILGELGLLLASYGVGLALILPISIRAAYPLPESTSPFAMSSGAGTAKGLLTMAVLFGAVLVSLPLQIAAHFLGTVWWWIGLPAGAAYGLGAYLISLALVGDLLDRRMPDLLATITQNRA
jgi:ABC-2 type transport system permease protein